MSDIETWLENLGLGKYAEIFAENEIDAEILPTLTASDLKDLGISIVGHRRKLLNAIERLARASGEGNESGKGLQRPVPTTQAERRQLTVMFVDLVASTALSERYDPEVLSGIIRVYQDCCANVTGRYEGYIAKYMGDGILIYFGWPQAHEDDAERALRAGLAIIEAIAKLEAHPGLTLQVRIGVATGTVVVGETIGEGVAQEQTVVGETPNMAARLQDTATPGAMVISAATRQLAGGVFEYEDLGNHRFKGFSESVKVWRVAGIRHLESRFEAHSAGFSPLVGREREIELLLDCWTRAKEGRGQVILLAGEPGIGKSRITQALYERLAGQSFTRLRYQCSPYYTNSALYPIITQLEFAAGFEPADNAADKLTKLEALLDPSGAGSDETVPLLADLLSIPSKHRFAPLELDPQQKKEKTLQTLIDQLLALAAQQPVLFILEDAHWIDPTTQELISLCIDRIRDKPVLMLITYRPEYRLPRPDRSNITQLTLNRLSHRQGRALVEKITSSKTLPAKVLAQIVEKTDGVPLFIEELTKTVIESGLLHRAHDLTAATGPLPVPNTLQDSLLARLDRLASAKEIAQTGAAIGREFSYPLIAAVCSRTEQALQQDLARLTASGLVFSRGRPPAATYIFKHALVQDAAYASLLKSRRRELHERIALALQENFTARAASEPDLLAHHFTEAGLTQQAIDHWYKAGIRAAGRSANAEAIAHLNRGLELLDAQAQSAEHAQNELRLQLALGPAYVWTMGYTADKTVNTFTKAHALATRLQHKQGLCIALFGQWLNYHCRTDFQAAKHVAAELMQIAESRQDSANTLLAHRILGQSLAQSGEVVKGAEYLKKAVNLYRPDLHRSLAYNYGVDLGIGGHAYLSWVCWVLGYPDRGLQHGNQAVASAEAMNHASSLAFAMYNMLIYEALVRRPVEAEQRARALAKSTKEISNTLFETNARVFLGWALVENRHDVNGLAIMRQSIAELRARNYLLFQPLYQSMMAMAYARCNKPADAMSCLDDAIELLASNKESVWEAEVHRLRGQLLLAQSAGTPISKAETCFRQAIDVARAQQARSFELRAAAGLARLWRDQNKRQQARDLLAPVYDWFSEGFDTADLKEAKALLTELA